MAMFNQLALSALTRNEEDAGTSSTLNVTVNVDGEDVLTGISISIWMMGKPTSELQAPCQHPLIRVA